MVLCVLYSFTEWSCVCYHLGGLVVKSPHRNGRHGDRFPPLPLSPPSSPPPPPPHLWGHTYDINHCGPSTREHVTAKSVSSPSTSLVYILLFCFVLLLLFFLTIVNVFRVGPRFFRPCRNKNPTVTAVIGRKLSQ